MRGLINQGKQSPTLNAAAASVVRLISPAQPEARARAIFNALARRVKFVPDVTGVETLRAPDLTWASGVGDCDDMAVLMAALLESVGFTVRLVTIAADQGEPDTFSHVYPEVLIGDKWVAADAARPGARFGRAPESYTRKRAWSLSDSGYADIAGLGFDWSVLAQAVPEVSAGTADIIAALRAAPQNLVPTTAVGEPSVAVGSSGAPMLLLLGGGLLLVLLVTGRGRR